MYEYLQLLKNEKKENINYLWIVLPKLLIIMQFGLILIIIREFKISHERNLSIFQKISKILKE